MATRKEEKERLRQARLEAERREASEARRRLFLGYVVAGLLAAAVVGGIVFIALSGDDGGAAHVSSVSGSTNGVPLDERSGTEPPPPQQTNLQAAAQAAGCELRENLPSEGRNHLPVGARPPRYETNPPTSGAHVEPPFQQADGAYSETPAKINFVHSLEHGRVEIQYSPRLPEADQLELKGLYDTLFAGSLLFPNGDMPYEVAATSWRNLLGCQRYEGAKTLDAIRAFGAAHFGNAPEPPGGTLAGPTPQDPEIPEG